MCVAVDIATERILQRKCFAIGWMLYMRVELPLALLLDQQSSGLKGNRQQTTDIPAINYRSHSMGGTLAQPYV
jgi:hypothetical protein